MLTAEDFGWDNIEKIEYSANPYEVEGAEYLTDLDKFKYWLTIYLKKQGKKHVLKAIKHFNTLDFVESADPNYYGKLL